MGSEEWKAWQNDYLQGKAYEGWIKAESVGVERRLRSDLGHPSLGYNPQDLGTKWACQSEDWVAERSQEWTWSFSLGKLARIRPSFSGVVPGPATTWVPARCASSLIQPRISQMETLGRGLSNLFPQALGVVLLEVSLFRATEIDHVGERVGFGENRCWICMYILGLATAVNCARQVVLQDCD